MADPRFFTSVGPLKLGALAEIAGAVLSDGADPERVIRDVAPLDRADADSISFLDNRRYLAAFEVSQAGVVIVDPSLAKRAPAGMDLLLTKQPYRGYALVAQAFYPEPKSDGVVHPTAIIDDSAVIGKNVSIGAYSVIGARAEIGDDVRIAAHCVIEDGVTVGKGTRLHAQVMLSYCMVGQNCELHSGVRLGARGFGFALDPAGYVDVPQLGRVIIEDGVEVGANTTIDRGAGPDTRIGAGSKIDNLVQVGHNVTTGRGCVLVAQSGVAGSTELKNHVIIAAQAGVAGHLTLGNGAKLAACSATMRDIDDGESYGGTPAMPIKEYFRLYTLWQRQLKEQKKKHD
jgi:UDP-3-O-[3-hydroxymyristoyl] glucosamine N-acyltransferase|tara:strand:- start:2483 stop:3514 length:1032 start_codon:yes stop_codon:yes gene_type:complete